MSFADTVADMDADLIDEFGVQVTFTPAGGLGASVDVILTSGQNLEDVEEGVHVVAFAPRSSFASAPAKGDTVTIPSGRTVEAGVYRVAKIEHDGQNGRRLFLKYVSAS
jgi:hypothetical protein